MTHNYTLQVQSQKLKQIPNCREPVVAMRITENPCDKIQLQLETINNQTYIIMEDVNLLKHKLLRERGDRTMLGARWFHHLTTCCPKGNRRQIPSGSGRAQSARARRVTSFVRRGKRMIVSICSFLF